MVAPEKPNTLKDLLIFLTKNPRIRQADVVTIALTVVATRSTFLQIHYKPIYTLMEGFPTGLEDYHYFKHRMVKGNPDAELERTMLFFEDASSVPVLLSMLVVVFGDEDNYDLPTTLSEVSAELYKSS